MKSYSQILSALIALALVIGVVQTADAQEDARAEAVTLYNEAQDLAGANQLEDAIETYRAALDVANDNELEDISERIVRQLPRVYYSRATRAFQQYQSERTIEAADRAIERFTEAREAGEEFNDDQVVQQSTRALPQLHYLKSTIQFRNEDLDDAMASLDEALELNPNYATAYYQRAIVYKKQNPEDIDQTLAYYDRAIELAEQTGDDRTLGNARSSAAEELIYRAVNLKDESRYSRAIELLEKVDNYDSDNPNAHYRLAEISNTRGNFERAIEHANRALDLETGGVTDRAKIYFELGTAYKGLNQQSNACSAFENANYGDFSEPASHELQFELECEGHSASGRR
ncbi:tetratricopeptide repeat protein [Rhodohalobacter sp. SW132]|uniref:tetratricopeptide repeat protein n=1 Tax=Rhodohalobacter sp. SW132 TaxID=2293433 RepID=UPI000E2748A6|nr:tetratricopeptide repeat protein [Rhodohalobacter sp. SW132]REL38143.1 tetratricopeptide repeat protein [Rhodohalobacter sp. SW132]